MKIRRINPPCDESGFDEDAQTPFANEGGLAQALQAWYLPLYSAPIDQETAEEYQLVHDMLLLADLVLGLT